MTISIIKYDKKILDNLILTKPFFSGIFYTNKLLNQHLKREFR